LLLKKDIAPVNVTALLLLLLHDVSQAHGQSECHKVTDVTVPHAVGLLHFAPPGVLMQPFQFNPSYTTTNKLRGPSPRSNYIDRVTRLMAKLVPTFADRGCCVVSTTDPHGHILCFLDRSCYFFPPSSPSVVLTRLSGPRSRPTTYQKVC
jgi:hypothetical protein